MKMTRAAVITLVFALFLSQPAFFVPGGVGEAFEVMAAEKSRRTVSPSNAAAAAKATASDAEAATPSSSDKRNKITTQEELIQAIEEGESDSILLLSDIVWEGHIWVNASRPVTVLMGDFNLFIPEDSSAGFSGPITFHGNGGGRPLISSDGFIGAYRSVRIEAEGAEATALRLGNNSEWELWAADITARGRGAAAIEYTGTREAELVSVRARAWGEESVGIRCMAPLTLKVCSIEAEGEAVSGDGAVTADCSRVFPMPSRAAVIKRDAFPRDRLEENGVCFEAGGNENVMETLEIYHGGLNYTMVSGAEDSYTLSVDAVWSGLPSDLSEPGTYYAHLTPVVPEWFPIKPPAQKVPIHMVDKSRPFIAYAREYGFAVTLHYFNEIQEADELLLEYSTDGGNTWKPAADMEISDITFESAYLGPLDMELAYRFRLTVIGGPFEGVSNVLRYRPNFYSEETGGDRDHDDRGDQGQDPPHGEIIPPPDYVAAEDGRPDNEGPGSGNEMENRSDPADPSADETSRDISATTGENSPEHTDINGHVLQETRPGAAKSNDAAGEDEATGMRRLEKKEERQENEGLQENEEPQENERLQENEELQEKDSEMQPVSSENVSGLTGEEQKRGGNLFLSLMVCFAFMGGGVIVGFFIYRKKRKTDME